jgi:hypothetical protein
VYLSPAGAGSPCRRYAQAAPRPDGSRRRRALDRVCEPRHSSDGQDGTTRARVCGSGFDRRVEVTRLSPVVHGGTCAGRCRREPWARCSHRSGVQLFAFILGESIPRLADAPLDRNVLMFTAATVFVTCIPFIMSPACIWRAELVGQLNVANRSIAPSPVVC